MGVGINIIGFFAALSMKLGYDWIVKCKNIDLNLNIGDILVAQ